MTEKKIETVDNSDSTKQVIGKKFFEYDAIDYYAIDFDESRIGELYDNQSLTEIDSFKMGIVLGDMPKGISDLQFIDKLATVGYKKTPLDKSKFNNIDRMFVEKNTREKIATSCIDVYRDILIFKKNSMVVGTVKVCFDCMANQITGTTANTESFGQNGDYGELKKILRQ
jgi:hypothetical protein